MSQETKTANKWNPLNEQPPLSLTSRWVICTTSEQQEIMMGLQFRNTVSEADRGEQGEWGKTREGYSPRAWLAYDPSQAAIEPELPLFIGEAVLSG